MPKAEHAATVSALGDGGSRLSVAQRTMDAMSIFADDEDADAEKDDDESKEEGPSEEVLNAIRTRVSALEAKLTRCVDDMRAARECTEVLPSLVTLVNNATPAGAAAS